MVERGANLAWYRGPTLLEILDSAPAAHAEGPRAFRFPVQWVCRPQTAEHHDFRGFAGRVESGEIAVGDEIEVLPSGRTSPREGDPAARAALRRAVSGQSVTLVLEHEVDVSRGDLLAHAGEGPPS